MPIRALANLSELQGLVTGQGYEADAGQFREACLTLSGEGRLLALFGADERAERGTFAVYAVFHLTDGIATLRLSVPAAQPSFQSLTPEIPAAHWFEREIWEMFGITPIGHPFLKPLALHSENWPPGFGPLLKTFDSRTPVARSRGKFPTLRVEGDGVFEIPVGPVHAGIIEPGHFRFSAVGEGIVNLEIRLGYQHRGVEKLFEGATAGFGLRVAERISGDTAAGHGVAFCQALEALAGIEPPPRARFLRVVALELERLANHVGDLGGIAADIGFAPGAAHFGRLRGSFLNLADLLSGHRFLMGFVVPGGVAHDCPEPMRQALLEELDKTERDFVVVAREFFDTPLVLDRLEHTGWLTRRTAETFGLVGPSARASGVDRDLRRDLPFAGYRELPARVVVKHEGDVLARCLIRLEEARESVRLIQSAIEALPEGPAAVPFPPLPKDRAAIGWAEAWRGEVFYWVQTGADGRFARVKVVDPSFKNWIGLSYAVIRNIVPDFPLCNKSFNLSYAGTDL